MIDVKYMVSDDIISLTLSGHAGSAEFGHDLICASATMLSYTLAGAVSKKYEDGELTNAPTVSLEPGKAHIACSPFPAERYGVISAYELIVLGFTILSGKYPEYVKLTKNGVSPERA